MKTYRAVIQNPSELKIEAESDQQAHDILLDSLRQNGNEVSLQNGLGGKVTASLVAIQEVADTDNA